MAIDVTETTFEQEVLEGSKETAVLVDFWAEWCGPCHAVSPVLEKIADERAGELKLVKVNIDENQDLASRYGVMSIPTMVLFKDGEPRPPRSARAPRATSSGNSASPRSRRLGRQAGLALPFFGVSGRRHSAPGRLLHEVQHPHPVDVDDRAAEPAAERSATRSR